MTKLFYLVNICKIFVTYFNMLKGANLKAPQRPLLTSRHWSHYVIICEHVFSSLEVFLGGRGGQCHFFFFFLYCMFSKDSERRKKKASSFNTTNLILHLKGRHCGKAVLRDFKQPPLLEL